MRSLVVFLLAFINTGLLFGQITNGQINYELRVDQWSQSCDNDFFSADDNEVRIGLTSDANTGGTANWTSGGNGATCGVNNYVRRWQADAPSTVTNNNTLLYICTNRNNVANLFTINHSSWEEDGAPDCDLAGDACQSSGTWAYTFKSATKTSSIWWGNSGAANGSFVTGQSGDFFAKTVWRYSNGSTCGTALNFGTLVSGVTQSHVNSNRTAPAGASTLMGYTNVIGNTSSDVYYQFTLTNAATVTISTGNAGSNYDTYLRLYSNTACGTQLAFDDDGGGGALSLITIDLCAGTYAILVEGFSTGVGDFNLSVLAVNKPASGGTIAGIVNGVSICSGDDPGAFTSSVNATGVGTISYQWESSVTSSAAGFSDIGSATASTYDPGNLTQTTWFRRRVTDGCGQIAYSNVIQVVVTGGSTLGTPSNAGPIEFCDAGGNFTTAVTVAGQTGTVMWDWGSNNGVWNNNWVAGNSSGVCCFPKKTSNSDGNADRMRYRVTNGSCPAVTSAPILIVNKYNEAPTSLASTTNNYCSSSVPANITLTATFPTNVNMNGTIRFYSGSCGGTLVGTVNPLATSATGAVTIAAPATTTTYYARYEPGAGSGCANSACVQTTVTVDAAPTLGTVSNAGPIDFCDAAGNFTTAVTVSGQTGTVNWNWGSNNGAWNGWVAGTSSGVCCFPKKISNSDGNADRMRYVVTNGSCPSVTSAPILVVNKYNEAPSSLSSTSSAYCSSSAPANITLTATFPTNVNMNGMIAFYSGSCGGTLVGTVSPAATSPTGAIAIASPSTTTTYYARYEPGAGSGCANSACVQTTVTVNSPSVAPTSITGTTTICSGSSTTLTLSGGTAGTGATAQWYTGSCGGTLIGTGNSISVSPVANTTYFVRYSGTCNTTTCASVTVTVNTLSIAPTSITGTTTICSGSSTTLTLSGGTAGTGATAQWYTGSCGGTLIGTGNSISVSPVANTTYFVRYSGTCNTTTCASASVTVSTLSTAPTITPVIGNICPNSSQTLTAGGGTAGTGSTISWYTGPNGSGTFIGNGASVVVSPTATTTYYARREGTCNNSSDDSETVNVKQFIYTPTGTSTSVGYCTDNSGWNHFFNAADEIIFSIQGDLSGASSVTASIMNNPTFFQQSNTVIYGCSTQEVFELNRSWNIDYVGTLNPPYTVRYYFPAIEKSDLEAAANAFVAANASCAYTALYPNPNGFYWFKNTGSAYTAPDFDGLHVTGAGGSINGVNYSQISGITSFSGGSGGITLVSQSVALPVTFSDFEGWNEGEVNRLIWTTQSEINNDKFDVERYNTETNSFEKIGEVDGNGNSSTPIHYNSFDNNPYFGSNLYRLKQIDFDGGFEYSDVINVDNTAIYNQRLHPTLTTGLIYYTLLNNTSDFVTINVVDLFGRTVQSKKYSVVKGNNLLEINIEDVNVGTYIISVMDDNSRSILNEKVVKITN